MGATSTSVRAGVSPHVQELQGSASVSLSWSYGSQPKTVIPSSALYSGTDTIGSPFNTTISAGDPPGALSTATGPGLTAATATASTSFSVTAIDTFANRQVRAGAPSACSGVSARIRSC
jgi:hypothetical protein